MSEDIDSKTKEFLVFFQEAATLRRDFADRGWESIKLFLLYATPLLVGGATVAITIYNFYRAVQLALLVRILYCFLLMTFPAAAGAISWITMDNFRRECRHMYEQIALLDKLSERLGLYDKRTGEIQLYKDDNYYVPDSWRKNNYANAKAFVDDMLARKDKFFGMMHYVFWTYIGLSIILFLVIITLFVFLF
jgi:hypothetical protein